MITNEIEESRFKIDKCSVHRQGWWSHRHILSTINYKDRDIVGNIQSSAKSNQKGNQEWMWQTLGSLSTHSSRSERQATQIEKERKIKIEEATHHPIEAGAVFTDTETGGVDLLLAKSAKEADVSATPVPVSCSVIRGYRFPAGTTKLYRHDLIGREAARGQSAPEHLVIHHQRQSGWGQWGRLQVFWTIYIRHDALQTFKRQTLQLRLSTLAPRVGIPNATHVGAVLTATFCQRLQCKCHFNRALSCSKHCIPIAIFFITQSLLLLEQNTTNLKFFHECVGQLRLLEFDYLADSRLWSANVWLLKYYKLEWMVPRW